MGGFKDYLATLERLPDGKGKDVVVKQLKNPLYHPDAEKIWGEHEKDYLPKIDLDRDRDPYNWGGHPIETLDTKSLISPQQQLDANHVENYPKAKRSKPITVTRTATGEHIIQDGNHRAVIAHATTGKIKAHVFVSKR